MNLRQLETFVAVAEESSFSRAADRLHVVQSAVSAGIRALEAELGAALLDRGPRGATLTDAGTALLPEARATLAAAEAARHAVRDARAGLRGTVTLGIMQSQRAPAPNVAEVLVSFKATHPGVQVRVRHGGGSLNLADQIRTGGFDLGFLSLRERPAGLDFTLLSRQPIEFACRTGSPLAERHEIDLSTVAAETMAELPTTWGTRIANDQAFAAAGVTRTVDYEVNDVTTLLEFVRHGLAVALLPASLIGDMPEITCVPIRDHPPVFEVSVATPSDRRLSPATRALLDHIKATAAYRG